MSLKEFAADDGAAIADATPPDQPNQALLGLSLIVEHPRNVRTVFEGLDEMVETAKRVGIMQPVLVRPLPASRLHETFEGRRKGDPLPTHELVDGHRRFRVAKLAGLKIIPALVRPMTDAEVLEAQIITALQRAGLTELDEAEGYRRLVEESGVPKEEIGAKIGKSRSYVYQRLKLLDLTPESRAVMGKSLADGGIDASRALLIARIPDSRLQAKALAEATRKDYTGGPALSVREFERWLHENVMLKLETARFDIKDETLHATAGACKACPKRTGANPDIFADVQGADICTDPKCFNAKASVHRDRLVAKAEAKGLTVIEGKAAKEICRQYSTHLEGYSRLDQKRTDVDESGPTLRKLLGKDAPAPVLIEHPFTKELIEAVPTAEAEAVLVAKGEIKPSQAKSGQQLEDKIDQLRSDANREGEQAARDAMVAVVKEAVRATPDENVQSLVAAELVRIWMLRQIEDWDAGETLVEALNLPVEGEGYGAKDEAAKLAIQAASDANVFRALVLLMASDEAVYSQYSRRDQSPRALECIAKTTGADLDGPAELARAERKKQLRNDIAALKAKLAPKPEKAPAKAKDAKISTAPPAAQKIRARKPSAEEVQAQIAEQLQALEGEQNQAPGGAEPEEGAASAAGGHDQAPDGASEEVGAAPAAPELSPMAGWPFPSVNGHQFGEGAAAPFSTGQLVRIKEGIRGPNGKVRKTAGKVGRVDGKSGEEVIVRHGPRSHEHIVLPAADVEVYDATPLIAIGGRVRVLNAGMTMQRNELMWREGNVAAVTSDGWQIDFPVGTNGEPARSETFEPSELEAMA